MEERCVRECDDSVTGTDGRTTHQGYSTHSGIGIDHKRLLPLLQHHFKFFTRHLVHDTTSTTTSVFGSSQCRRRRRTSIRNRSSESWHCNPPWIRSKRQCEAVVAVVVVAADTAQAHAHSRCENQPSTRHCRLCYSIMQKGCKMSRHE